MSVENKLIAEALKNVPTMPNIIIKALSLVKNPDTSMKKLGDIISYDQSLSTNILRLVNSAYYGFSQPITSIAKAVTLIGITKTKHLIITISMKSMFSGQNAIDLWHHCIKTAIACQYISDKFNISTVEDTFTMGFLHDIGKMILAKRNPIEMAKIDELVKKGSNVLEAEKAFFKIDHCELGGELAKKWNLPILLTEIIRFHHTPERSAFETPITLVYIANNLVKDNFNLKFLEHNFVKKLNLDTKKLVEFRAEILEKANLLITELSNKKDK